MGVQFGLVHFITCCSPNMPSPRAASWRRRQLVRTLALMLVCFVGISWLQEAGLCALEPASPVILEKFGKLPRTQALKGTVQSVADKAVEVLVVRPIKFQQEVVVESTVPQKMAEVFGFWDLRSLPVCSFHLVSSICMLVLSGSPRASQAGEAGVVGAVQLESGFGSAVQCPRLSACKWSQLLWM